MTHPIVNAELPPRRSLGSLREARIPVRWPSDRIFRILSIDGGGVRGLFPAALLAALETHFLGGQLIGRHFDLITGTSTGGIIAVGLGAEIPASRIREMYVKRGREIFPPSKRNIVNRCLRYLRYAYDTEPLSGILADILGTKRLGEAVTRLCIPSLEGTHGEPYIFKTPHHPDFIQDQSQLMSKVATYTAVAPTFFRPLEESGYIFLDGGVWANNPIMIGLVDALSCFDVERSQVRILSVGCGDSTFPVKGSKIWSGGRLSWHDIIHTAISLQSHDALGQARLLIGADRILRVSPPSGIAAIALDDWRSAVKHIPQTIDSIVNEVGERIYAEFLSDSVRTYTPFTCASG